MTLPQGSPKKCDHTSVGMFVWKNDKLLLIERAKFPFGYAVPAGHLDGDTDYEIAARRELKEEVGLDVVRLDLVFDGRKENPCRREDGTWHHWKLYRVESVGDLSPSLQETKRADWYSVEQIEVLTVRTKKFLAGEISPSEWEMNPGLEPVMAEFWNSLRLLDN